MKRIKTALIGCGGMSGAHVMGYRELSYRNLKIFSIESVCDVNEEKAKTRAGEIYSFQRKKPKRYTNFREMLAKEDLEAVDICTDHRSHHSIANYCMGEGLDMIIEKPLAITMRAGKTMMDAAKKHGKILAVAENYRRIPVNRVIKWCIDQGEIGEPRMIVWQNAGWSLGPMGWRGDKLMAGGSWVFDGGVHLADLDRYQSDREATEVYGVAETFEPVKGSVRVSVDDVAMAIIRYEDVYAEWLWTMVAPGKGLSSRVIYGSKGSVDSGCLRRQEQGSVMETSMSVVTKKMLDSFEEEVRERMFPKGIRDSVATELYDFYDAIVHERTPEVDAIEAYHDMAVPIAIYESSKLRKPVRISDVEKLKVEEYQKEINDSLSI